MPETKLFITGGTGYIGGSVLEGIVKKYPELKITALLRKPSTEFRTRYPHVTIVEGDFDASDVIEKASTSADIVVHTGDTDHPGCATAILSGLKKKTIPSFLIHLSGTGCISDREQQIWEGDFNPRVWDDIKDIKELHDLPDSAMHHIIDRDIMDASNDLLKTAIICPPDIYGQSTGVGARTSFMVPMFVNLFTLLVEQAINGGGSAQWGKEGFYFGVSDEVKWIDAAEAINKLGAKQGWLPPTSKPVSWTKEQVGGLMPGSEWMLLYLWGSNSRAASTRATALGWKPKGPSFFEALEEDVTIGYSKLNQ